MRLASRRCCSSACGIRTLLKSSQSGKKRSSERTGLISPSRFWPAQAMLPWRVATIDRARSKVNAAAWPPAEPTLRSVTAGRDVLAVALE
jgi:hypothetical protein